MIHQIFAVKDSATQQFGTPMFVVSAGQMIRSFTDEVNKAQEGNQLFMHPDDFELYRLGEFETNSGSFSCSSPEMVCRGKDVKVRS